MSETIYWRMREFPSRIWRITPDRVERYFGGGCWVQEPDAMFATAERMDANGNLERFTPDWKEQEQ